MIDENRDVLHGAVSWLVDTVQPGNVEDAEDADRPKNWALESSRRRWIDKNSVLEASGRCPRSLEAGGFSQFCLGAVGSTKKVFWRAPGGAGSTKLVV